MRDFSTPLQAALTYAHLGFRVIPLHNPVGDGGCSCEEKRGPCRVEPDGTVLGSPGKHPRTKHGLDDGTTTRGTIRRWWRQWPDANVGIVTGEVSGLVVVDVDPDKGGEESLKQLEVERGELPVDARALTGGAGFHYVFAHPGVRIRNKAGTVLGAGLDVRGDGGYIVAAPSLHISGARYSWLSFTHPLPELPACLLELLREPERAERPPAPPRPRVNGEGPNSKYGLKALDDEVRAVSSAVEGTRNDTLVRAAMNLFELANGGELEPSTVWTQLRGAGVSAGLSEAETEQTLKSAHRKVAGNARTAPPSTITATRPPDLPPPPTDADAPGSPPAPPPPVENSGAEAPEREPVFRMRTDIGNGERLVDSHGHELRHVRLWGKWLVWDGTRWQRDETGRVVERAKSVVRSIYTEASICPDPDQRPKLSKHAVESERASRVRAMIDLASSDVEIALHPDQLDADPWLLNCRNGTLDLCTGELRAHDQADLITRRIDIDWDEHARCDRWLAFLEWCMRGDAELVQYLQRAVGYSLTGSTREQVLFFLHGGGQNGKSTVLGVLLSLLGEYGTQTEPDLLMAHRGEPHPTGLADLTGKRLAVTVEVEAGKRMAESLVKTMTGEKRMKARFMRQDFFEFTPTFKLWLAGNHKPVITGTDTGIWRRMRLIPFTNSIDEKDQDKTLIDKLEAELPGILAWAVTGCLAWQHYGLGTPAAVAAATDQYRDESDVLNTFIGDTCVVDPNAVAKSSDLYEEYSKWCERNGHQRMASNTFGRRLAERDDLDPTTVGTAKARAWRGIGLRDARPEQQQLDHASAAAGDTDRYETDRELFDE